MVLHFAQGIDSNFESKDWKIKSFLLWKTECSILLVDRHNAELAFVLFESVLRRGSGVARACCTWKIVKSGL